jgi:transcription initiation factor TFIID subunit 2
VYTTPSSPDAARCWVPCLDSLFDKSTWDFEFVVPSFLEERDEGLDLLDEDLDYVDDRNRTIVVCSGDLVEQVGDWHLG